MFFLKNRKGMTGQTYKSNEEIRRRINWYLIELLVALKNAWFIPTIIVTNIKEKRK
jgi:hypothetical protein